MDRNSMDGLRDKVMQLDEKEQLYRNRLSLSARGTVSPLMSRLVLVLCINVLFINLSANELSYFYCTFYTKTEMMCLL